MSVSYARLVAAGLATVCLAASAGAVGETYRAGMLADSVKSFVDDHTIAGAVLLVASKDGVLATETVGYADIEKRAPMKPDTLFWIASMTKAMTTTAVMMLVDEGKVSLDDPVQKYLPEFAGQMVVVERDSEHALLKKPAHPITIREMLSHLSGLPSGYPFCGALDGRPLRYATVVLGITPLSFEPGTRFEYGNSGYATAGRIIEVVSGMSYEEFMQKRLLTPLGMKDTTFHPTAALLKRLAKAYVTNAEKTGMTEVNAPLTYPLDGPDRTADPAGGLFSTAADISRYCRMVMAGGVYDGKRYLSEASVRQMTTTQTGALLNGGNGEGGYGLGWNTSGRDHGHGLSAGPFSHSGAYRTDMWIDQPNGLICVFMTQRGDMLDSSPFTNPFHKVAEEVFVRR